MTTTFKWVKERNEKVYNLTLAPGKRGERLATIRFIPKRKRRRGWVFNPEGWYITGGYIGVRRYATPETPLRKLKVMALQVAFEEHLRLVSVVERFKEAWINDKAVTPAMSTVIANDSVERARAVPSGRSTSARTDAAAVATQRAIIKAAADEKPKPDKRLAHSDRETADCLGCGIEFVVGEEDDVKDDGAVFCRHCWMEGDSYDEDREEEAREDAKEAKKAKRKRK